MAYRLARKAGLMSILVTIVSFAIVLGILVFIHELGHYWVAKRNGIVVEEFGMGYPPRLVKLFTYDGTEFTINWIPFGGFARMKGEDGGDMSPGSFNAASRGARAATLIAGPLMNALLAIVLFAASFMVGFPATAAYPQVTTVTPDSLAAEVGLQPDDILVEANGTPTLVNAMPELRDEFWTPTNASAAATLKIIRDDAIMQLDVENQQTVADLLSTIAYRPILDTLILDVFPDSPADTQGMLANDLVYKIDGELVTYDYGSSLIDIIRRNVEENPNQALSVVVYRNGELVDLSMTPRVAPPEGQGALGVRISSETQLATLPILPSLWQGVVSTTQYVTLVLQLPFMLFSGALSPADAQFAGPVGIANMVGEATTATLDTGLWFPILRLSAVLSAALAITNMLPIPALDGGRLLFILIETLRGRRINPEREGLVHMVGFMLLLGLMFYITVQDIRLGTMSIDWHALLGQ